MNASSADAGRDESGRPSTQVANSTQPVIGLPRGGSVLLPERAGIPNEFVDNGQPIELADTHPLRRDAAWVERELGDVTITGPAGTPCGWHRALEAFAKSRLPYMRPDPLAYAEVVGDRR